MDGDAPRHCSRRRARTLLGSGVLAGTLLWGLDGGILAALAVGIPYILTFYFVLALLEDSGYMNAAAFFADRVMHLFGLHGRAVIPLMAAAGCNVPAIMGTRVLATERERTHRQRAHHPGALQRAHGRHPRCRLLCSSAGSGRSSSTGSCLAWSAWRRRGAQPLLPGEPSGLIMEVFPFRRPSLRLVTRKTW